MSELRVALRIARRTSLRSLGRSALIVTMVAIPVTGLAAVALVGDSMFPTVAEQVAVDLGGTEARVVMVNPPDPTLVQNPTRPAYWQVETDDLGMPVNAVDGAVVREVAEILPAGTRVLPIFYTSITALTATGVGGFEAVEGEAWDPSFAGRYDLVEGRGPVSRDEIAVTASALPRLGASIGDRVYLDSRHRFATVVGVVDDQTRPASDQVIFGITGALSSASDDERRLATEHYLPDLVLSWSDVQALNTQGATVFSRSVLLSPPPPGTYSLYLPNDEAFLGILSIAAIFAGLVAFEVILLAGAAFTVNAREQQHTLAIIGSTGAGTSTLVRIVTANGLVLGAAGGIVGLALGILGGSLFMVLSDDGSATQYDGYHLPWLLMIGFVAFAVLIGWLASLVPARVAARVDIVSALRGARRPPTTRMRRPVLGIVLLTVGVPVTVAGGILLVLMTGNNEAPRWIPGTMLVVGPILVQLGLILCGPLLLRAIARVRLGGTGARLASRDTARNPGRSVPALAAILSAVFIAVVAMNVVASVQKMQENYYGYWTMPGQVMVPLTYQNADNSTGQFDAQPEQLAMAVRSSVDVDQLRPLSSVQEQGTVSSTSEALFATLLVPAANRCPDDPYSTDWKPDGYEYDSWGYSTAMDNDPRCESSFIASFGGSDKIWVGDSDDLTLILGREPSDEAVAALESGGAVSLYSQYVENDSLTIGWWTARQWNDSEYLNPANKPERSASLPAVVDSPEHPIQFAVMISPTTANELGLDYRPSLILASLLSPETEAQSDSLLQSLRAVTGASELVFLKRYEAGPQSSEPWIWGILAICAAVAVAAAAVAVGLARFDGRRDVATLSSLGASPVLRRNVAFWQALIITGLGALLGTALGLLPSLGLGIGELPFAPPWLQLGLVVVVLPLVVASASWLLASARASAPRRLVVD